MTLNMVAFHVQGIRANHDYRFLTKMGLRVTIPDIFFKLAKSEIQCRCWLTRDTKT